MQVTQDKTTACRLLGCLLLAAGICAAQSSGRTVPVFGVLLLYLAVSVYAAAQDCAMLFLFFFLPWSPILKPEPGSFSFYTFSMLAICGVHFLRAGFRLPARCLAAAVAILGITSFSKILDGNLPQFNYCMFVFLLVFFPLAASELKRSVTAWEATVFFSAGIIAAALFAAALAHQPGIARYIDVYSWNGVVRRSGFYGDANFYAAQITAALAGVLMLLTQAACIRAQLLGVGLFVLLFYCGLLSASKSFAITAAAVCLVWGVSYLRAKIPMQRKLVLLAILVVFLLGIGSVGILNSLVETLLFRLRQGSSLADFTTGRTELWRNYLLALTEDPKLLLFGKGFTNVKLNGRGSHNTLLQLIYQFGLVGGALLLLWKCFLQRTLFGSPKYSCRDGRFLALLVGVFLPWMAIDMLFFDEFFLLPVYVMAAGKWMERGADT